MSRKGLVDWWAIGFEMIWGCRGAIDISCDGDRSVPTVGRGLRLWLVGLRACVADVFGV
ncbi:hypothetical protein [Microcoleus sp. C2D2]|uniref:hypothetical protein n=1 Tax=Microcoleus sp. C2D2 TaxID=3055326 RepID=UPI002FD78E39